MRPESLYEQVSDLFAADDEGALRAAVALADSQYSAMHARAASPHDAETSRIVSLATAKLGDYGGAAKWRARALSRFVLTGWVEGVAVLLIGSAFVELGRENADYPAGQFLDAIKPSNAALAILDDVDILSAGTESGINISRNSPSPALIARLLQEKRGFLLLLQGDFGAARTAYERALEAGASSLRGRIKVSLGMALLHYVDARKAGGRGGSGPTAALVAEAEETGEMNLTDLINVGRFNIAQMVASSMHLKPYEVL